MLKLAIRLLFILAILFLATACGSGEHPPAAATEGPVASNETLPSHTASPQPPTHTPVPATPTASAIPPTPTATPEPATPAPSNSPPVISGLEDQEVPDDERFLWISLDEHVDDPDDPDDAIAWTLSGAVDLRARILQPARQLRVDPPTTDWRGSETLHLEACDPGGLCDSVDIVYTVLEENDAPVVHLDNQIVRPGQGFPPLALDDHVLDVDNAVDELAWSYSGSSELLVTIVDRVLEVELPGAGWHGRETVHLQACDPGGECGSADVMFAVITGSDVLVTFVCNAGFLIDAGGKRILIDALYPGDVSPETLGLMESALPPFDGVDLVLATHDHADHFDPVTVGRHLTANPKARFVSTESAVEMLREGYPGFDDIAERVIPIHLRRGASVRETVNGIDLEILNLPHEMEGTYKNLGFVMSIGDHVLFHTGDSSPESMTKDYFLAYDLPSRHIDVAFVAYFVLQLEEEHWFITQGIQARYIVPMHFLHTLLGADFEIMETYFPDAVVFRKELETWLMPQE